jgi:hypothetical protein
MGPSSLAMRSATASTCVASPTCLHRQRTPRLLVNQRYNILGLGGAVTIVHADGSSLARQPQCNCATYPTGRAGDHCGPAWRALKTGGRGMGFL